jgi:hypothetical protein
MPLTNHAIEMFISKKVTQVTEYNVTNLLVEFQSAKTWISSFGLMVIFVNQPRENVRPFALQFLRHAEMALTEYALAGEELKDLVFGKKGRWSPYFRALYHFESAITQLYQAYDFSRKILGEKLFDSNDGSPLDRLNKISNVSKRQVATDDQPVWITNTGIETEQASITFGELEELLRACAKLATRLTTTSQESQGAA